MSLLTHGLGSIPIGLSSQSARGALGHPKWGPSKILTGGLGVRSALTAHYPYHNTPVMCFYTAPKSESEVYDFEKANPADPANPTLFSTTLEHGKVIRDAEGKPIFLTRCRDANNVTANLASVRPYLEYGTKFKQDPIALQYNRVVDANDNVTDIEGSPLHFRPLGDFRVASAGDLEYATMTPDPHSVYNARSILIIFPTDVALGPRSLDRLRFYLRRTKQEAVNLRVRKDKGRVILELLNPKTTVKSIRQQIGRFFVEIKLARTFDLITEQEYSGME